MRTIRTTATSKTTTKIRIFAAAMFVVATPAAAIADTYTQASFSGAINGGSANVKAPFNTNGFTQGDALTGSFVFDNNLVPAAGSGFQNVFMGTFPDIAKIPNAAAFNITLDKLTFNAGDNLNSLLLPGVGIQYNNGTFNGFVFVTDFPFLGSEYEFRINGPVITVKLIDPNTGFPGLTSLINARINIAAGLTGETPFIPGSPTNETPLPGALPLFATGLGALGLLGWRRKRRAQEGRVP